MSCHLHNQKQEVSHCNVCGKPICNECLDVQNYYESCPSCSKEHLKDLYANYKKGLIFNILSVICIVAFFVVFAIDIASADQVFIIVGSILGGIGAIVSVALLIRTVLKMHNLKKLLELVK